MSDSSSLKVSLPLDVLYLLFSMLDLSDVGNLACTCKNFYIVNCKKEMWKVRAKTRLGPEMAANLELAAGNITNYFPYFYNKLLRNYVFSMNRIDKPYWLRAKNDGTLMIFYNTKLTTVRKRAYLMKSFSFTDSIYQCSCLCCVSSNGNYFVLYDYFTCTLTIYNNDDQIVEYWSYKDPSIICSNFAEFFSISNDGSRFAFMIRGDKTKILCICEQNNVIIKIPTDIHHTSPVIGASDGFNKFFVFKNLRDQSLIHFISIPSDQYSVLDIVKTYNFFCHGYKNDNIVISDNCSTLMYHSHSDNTCCVYDEKDSLMTLSLKDDCDRKGHVLLSADGNMVVITLTDEIVIHRRINDKWIKKWKILKAGKCSIDCREQIALSPNNSFLAYFCTDGHVYRWWMNP